MKLIVICQAVDASSSTLGFFVEWLKELGRQCEEVQAFGFEVGQHDLPKNVVVTSGGKERGAAHPTRLLRLWKFLWRTLPTSNGVFVHMSPEYAIAAWPIAALRRKPMVLWYAHRSVTRRLKLAEKLVRRILTISPTSCRLETPKKIAIGHGIPTNIFRPMTSGERDHRMVTVGRLTPIKQLELMVEALALVRKQDMSARLDVIGEAIYDDDKAYEARIRKLVTARGLENSVNFLGAVPYPEFPVRYASYALALNMAPTGALDKAVLEAMACGVPALVTNENFRPSFGADADRLVAKPTSEAIADKMRALLTDHDTALGARLRSDVERAHSLVALVTHIVETFKTV